MADDPIPDDVRTLLEQHFTSVSELEALLVLIREPRPWTPPELARALVISEQHAALLLDTLRKTRLVAVRDGAYRFAPSKPEERSAAESLAALYDRYRLRIMNIVFSTKPDPLREFGESFRIRRRDDDNGGGSGG